MTADGVVILSDGTPLRAVEVVPTHLPYHPSELDERILRAVIAMTKARSSSAQRHAIYQKIGWYRTHTLRGRRKPFDRFLRGLTNGAMLAAAREAIRNTQVAGAYTIFPGDSGLK